MNLYSKKISSIANLENYTFHQTGILTSHESNENIFDMLELDEQKKNFREVF